MTCYAPIKAFRTSTGVVFAELSRYDIIGRIDLPCGQCIGCRLRRARDWSLRIMHESSLYKENCFLTLTYARDCLPPNGSLCYRDYQLFMKRTRSALQREVRFFMCGEYGTENRRPHYHACMFNVDFRSDRKWAGRSGSGFDFYMSERLSKLWPHGRATVQDLTSENAGYTARYCVDKVTGPNAELHYRVVNDDGGFVDLEPEFARCSLKPGIGARWYELYGRDVYPHDFVVSDGTKFAPPRYYDRLEKKAADFDAIEFARQKRAISAFADNTDARLQVREVVQKARIRNLRRNLNGD